MDTNYDGIKGIAEEAAQAHKRYELLVGHEIDIDNADERQVVGLVPYWLWKVIGLGLFCTEASTDGEAPILEFGDMGDDNLYGTFTITAEAGKGMHESEYSTKETMNYFPADDFDADAPAYAWSHASGHKFDIAQEVIGEITVIEAAAGAMASGKFIPFALIEVTKGSVF